MKNITGLEFVISWINTTQQELAGSFNDQLSIEVVSELKNAGFVYDPELSFGDNDEILNIVNEAIKEILGTEDLGYARIIARELSFEGIHRPAK